MPSIKTFSILLGGILSCSCLAVIAQSTDNHTIMTINGKDFSRAEFLYSYNKNGKGHCSVAEYTDLFINYQLKVQAALAARIDTITSFNEEFRQYRDQQLVPFLIDSVYEDSIARSVYEKMKLRIGDADLLKVSHIFLPLSSKADTKTQQALSEKMDSIYTVLYHGADFSEIAKAISQDKATARKGGELPWIGPGSTIKEFEDVAYSLQKGQLSRPFLSPMGYHIILLKERKKLEPYEERREELLASLKAQGLDEVSFRHSIEMEINASKGKLTREDVIQKLKDDVTRNNPELAALIKEYYNGLLLFEVTERQVWKPAEKDITGIQKYFKAHKADYQWPEPRFKGFVFHCKDASLVKDVTRTLKKNKDENWTSVIRNTYNAETPRVIISRKLYEKGTNAFVDEKVFGGKPATPVKSYPYTGVFGKILKKGPETYLDVKSEVISDYQDKKEKEWVSSLRKNATIEIVEPVLESVKRLF